MEGLDYNEALQWACIIVLAIAIIIREWLIESKR